MTTVVIAYAGNGSTRFDRTYYSAEHLPLVMSCWEQYGLRSVAAFYPEDDGRGTIAICLCVFSNEDAVKTSFASEGTRKVMDDIVNFTDATPFQWQTSPLR